MAAKSSAYDRAATMFSPDGRLYQVEYASKIVEQGTLGLGVIYNNGVLLAADKKIASKLILPDSIEKLFMIDDHIGAISSGLVGDARRLVQFARQEAQENSIHYDEPIGVETIVKRMSAIAQYFTQYGGVRPFGVSFIVAGVDYQGFRLFETEPSGALAEYKAIAIGRGKKEAMEILEKEFSDGLTREEVVQLVFEVLKKAGSVKGKIELSRIDVAFIEKGKPLTRFSKEELKSLLNKSKTA
ncbi:archaeal proteasome endopeptidase complex subunit alpha [Candidatus Micrarchaeota archaeon]|nr:archaeal proteasome endopeptidase complex subunit alpha [Candidatus Micrarchaeota archaeon]MBU1930683.1 archaeal proteasome endopeptidase complex subunit alpha [Candidatus Micrarchaeota archaeon]